MIETERLTLRKIKIEDAQDIFEYAKDSDTGPMAGWPPHETIDDTKEIINSWLQPDCKEQVFAIVHKKDKKIIGTMGVVCLNVNKKDEGNNYINNLIEGGVQVYEIGNVIAKPYWGNGLSTECLQSMINYLFTQTNADMIITCHYAENKGSCRVQEKCGMKVLDSYERDTAWYNTDCKTMVVRGKTRKEWIAEHQEEGVKGS